MAKDVIIDQEQLQQANAEADKLKASLDTSYNQVETLIQTVQSAQWQGKSRDSFLTYLELIIQYHAEMKDAAAKHQKALRNMTNYQNDFLGHSNVRSVKNV